MNYYLNIWNDIKKSISYFYNTYPVVFIIIAVIIVLTLGILMFKKK